MVIGRFHKSIYILFSADAVIFYIYFYIYLYKINMDIGPEQR